MTPKKTRSRNQPVKEGLKGFSTARKTSNNLMRDIQQHVVAEGNKNAGVGRESHKIHVSEVIKSPTCQRQMFYKITEQEPTDQPAAAYHRLEIIWASGHDAHHKWQKWMWGMGDLWGTFSCRVCGHKWVALAPDRCANCGEDREFLVYDEVEFEDEHYHLVGHADGAVPRLGTLVEIKSFSVGTVRIENPALVKEHTHKVDGKTVVDTEAIWAAIRRPLKSHLHQGLFYLWFCKRMGLPYDKITYIYENKTTQATKTFVIKLTERFLADFLATLDEVVAAVDAGAVPKRPNLFSRDAKPCNVCVFRSHCWGEENDDDSGTQTPEVSGGGSGDGGEAPGREAALYPAGEARGGSATRSRRRHGDGRPGADEPDGPDDSLGREHRRATGSGRGRRAVGRGPDGSGTRSRLTRNRQGRD